MHYCPKCKKKKPECKKLGQVCDDCADRRISDLASMMGMKK